MTGDRRASCAHYAVEPQWNDPTRCRCGLLWPCPHAQADPTSDATGPGSPTPPPIPGTTAQDSPADSPITAQEQP